MSTSHHPAATTASDHHHQNTAAAAGRDDHYYNAAMSYMPMDVESAAAAAAPVNAQSPPENAPGNDTAATATATTAATPPPSMNLVGKSSTTTRNGGGASRNSSVFFPGPFTSSNKNNNINNNNKSATTYDDGTAASQAESSSNSGRESRGGGGGGSSSVMSFTSTYSAGGAFTVVGKENKPEVVTAIYISIFAMLGALTRMVTAQVFGEECASPGTVGWLAASAPLCVTADGVSTSNIAGGVIFADLPANLFGSFIMGLFQNGHVLDLAVPMAIAWLPPQHAFQDFKIIHKAITTGYCGSVTTFSGWNSAMVVQIFGTGSNRQTHIFNAIFGYIIGVETALGSFVCGKSVARRLHQLVNPKMAVEEAAMKIRREEGVHLNHNLPDFERRYLHDLYGETSIVREAREFYGDLFPVERLEAIERWRKSTKHARRVNHPLLSLLVEIENVTLVQNVFPIPEHLAEAAQTHDWDVDALREWQNNVSCAMLPSMRSTHADFIMKDSMPPEKSRWLSISVSAAILTAFVAFNVAGLVLLTGQNSYTITNRNMTYALLFAPAGALLRWRLSIYNGTLSYQGWRWFPLGTFAANLIGSIISIGCIAIEYNLNSDQNYSFWGIGTIRAFKVGFAGCLTTVSTFVAESSGFMKNTDHAYPYMLTTIACCCSVGCFIYGIILWADKL